MILPARLRDRQQRKYPFARRKKISRKEGEPPRKKEIPLRLCVNKKKCLPGLEGFAPSREKNRSQKEEKPQRSRPLCGFATLRLRVNKKRRPYKARYPAVGGHCDFARSLNQSDIPSSSLSSSQDNSSSSNSLSIT
jgi:hypothetical protein